MEIDFREDRPPEGYRPLLGRADAERTAGPFYERQTDEGHWQLGFRVTSRKLNKMGVCHGGVLATFADIQGGALKKSLGLMVDSPTINISIDYVGPAPAGAWVHSTPELVRHTGRLLFFQAIFYADEVVCARASGIYRLLAKAETG
jgi:uncharacterized protein (TIGR00369 family)